MRRLRSRRLRSGGWRLHSCVLKFSAAAQLAQAGDLCTQSAAVDGQNPVSRTRPAASRSKSAVNVLRAAGAAAPTGDGNHAKGVVSTIGSGRLHGCGLGGPGRFGRFGRRCRAGCALFFIERIDVLGGEAAGFVAAEFVGCR